MPEAGKRPCSICRRRFRPDARVGDRPQACGKAECQAARRRKTQAQWRAANPDYAAGYRLQQRSAQQPAPEPLRLPAPLRRLPWDLAKDQFGAQGADFLGVMGTLLARSTKDQSRTYLSDSTRLAGALPPAVAKDQLPTCLILKPEARQPRVDATGISSTGAALGAPAGAPPGPAAAAAGLAGGSGPADSHRGGGGRGPGEPLRGHRRLQAHRGAFPGRKPRWNRAGCWRRWNNASVTDGRNWRAGSTAA